MSTTSRVYKSEESDIDKYITESLKSYKGCKIKNCARRTSLQKKPLGIDIERKLMSSKINREEKNLKEHLRQLYRDRIKCHVNDNPRVQCECCDTDSDDGKEGYVPTDPYPITFPKRVTSSSKKSKGKKGPTQSFRRGRRLSKEFEDLNINTATGQIGTTTHINELLSPYRLSPGLLRKTLSSDSGSSFSSLEDLRSSREHATISNGVRPKRHYVGNKKILR